MRNLDENKMRHLSFPDFQVEKMELVPKQKRLKVFVEGAWLEENGGEKLGKGILFFNDWGSLSIIRFDPSKKKWSKVEIDDSEQLRDLCEVDFGNGNAILKGFGRKLGLWLEWKIENVKMHAEFEGN